MTITFKKDKETKNAVRYAEQADEGKAIVGSLYVKKSEVEDKNLGDTVTVELSAA